MIAAHCATEVCVCLGGREGCVMCICGWMVCLVICGEV